MLPDQSCPLVMDAPTKWTRCCRGSGRNCPSIAIQQDRLQIRDDDGQVVTMTLDQFDDVVATLTEAVRFRSKIMGDQWSGSRS